MASSSSGHAVVAKSMAGQSTTTTPTTEAKRSSSVSGTQASLSVASAAPAASDAPPTPRHQHYPPPAVSTSSSAHQSTAASAQPPAPEAAAKDTSRARATPAWSGVSAPGAAAVSAAPSGGVPASISIGAGGKAGGVGVAGGQAGQSEVQSGTRSAPREPNAGFFGTGADAGILNNSSNMTSIEVAARAAAVADGVIRSDTPQQQQQQQDAPRHPSVAQTPATIPSATATPVTTSALANTAFTNGVHHHQVHAIASAAAAQGATRTIYNGAYGVQRHQELQQMPSAGGVPVGYGSVQAELRLSFPQGGMAGSFLGLSCGDHVSRAHAQAQAQAQAQTQAHAQTHAHVEAQARAQAQMEAEAHAQAQAKAKKPNGLRRGKWTTEEEEYANRLIQEFKSGLLPLTDGTTLRTFLSKLLNCDPMRISKKFVGSNCIGKQVFRRRQADMDRLQTSDIERSRSELADLERRFLERVAMTNRCKTSGEIGPKEGGRESDVMRPHHPPVVTQPWMLPPSPSPGAFPANHVTSMMGQQIPASTPGVTLMDPARTFLSSTLASNGSRALELSSTAGSMSVKPTPPTAAATEVSSAPAVSSAGTSAVNIPVAGSSTPKVAINSNAIGLAAAVEVHRQTPVGSHQQPKTENLSNYQHHLQQQQQRGVVASSSTSPTETGATRSDASSSTLERAPAVAASSPPAPLAPVSSSFASASTSALDVPQPGSFLDVGGALTPTGSGTEAREVQCGETEADGGVDPSRIKAKQEPVEGPPTREVGLSFRNSDRANDGAKIFNSGLLGSAGATATSAAAVLGVGIDRTTSLEALSLLELPHLQGMPNLALLGLGPALPTSSSALSLTMSLPITSVKGGTSGVGLKRTPSWARIGSYENLQSLAEGFPVGPTSSGLNGTGTSGSDNAGGSHGLGASSCSNTMGSGSGSTPAAFMPRNTSVEDFLSLVESGDIPPPEGSAGFTVPMWIYGDDGKSAEKAPARSSSNPDKGSSASSSCLISGSVDTGVAEQPRSKRLKVSSAKTEAKG